MATSFISRRYLWRRLAITIECCLGIIISVAALNIVLSVMTGFSSLLQRSIRGTLSDIVVSDTSINGFEGYERLLAEFSKMPHVAACAPRVEGYALALVEKNGIVFSRNYCRFIGVDPELEAKVSQFGDYVGAGLTEAEKLTLSEAEKKKRIGVNADFKLDGKEVDFPIIPGFEMMPAPRPFEPGDRVTLFTFNAEQQAVYQKLTVVNSFLSGVWEYDRYTVYTTLRAAQTLKELYHTDEATGKKTGWKVTNINVKVDDPANIDVVKQQLRDWLDDNAWNLGNFTVNTWRDERANFLTAVDLERKLQVILMGLILLVSAFLIMALLSMVVSQKTRDIGILRAVGASRWSIMKVFLGYGFFIGLVGATLGLACSLQFLYSLDTIEAFIGHITGFKPFNREIYNFDRIPREYNVAYMATTYIFGVVTSVAASLYPAVKAAAMKPINALRYE